MEEDETAWECPVCLEQMVEIGFPVSDTNNPCTHSFCIPCTQSLTDAARLKSQILQCPICRRHIHGFIINRIASSMIVELDKCKYLLREAKEKEKDTHRRERKLAQDNNVVSLRVAQLEGELVKALSDCQCEADRNEHFKKMCNLVEMEKETLSERLFDLQRKLQAELEESSRRIGIMENEVVEYQKQLRMSAEEAAKTERENNELSTQIRDTEARVIQVLEEKQSLETRSSELEHQLLWANTEIRRIQSEQEAVLEELRTRMAHEIRKVQSEHEASQEELRYKLQNSSALEKRSRDFELKSNQLEAEVKRAKEEMLRADRRASEMDISIRKSESERAGTSQIVLQLETMLSTYKDEVRHLEREKYECTKKAAELEGTLARMRSDASKTEEEKISMKERLWKAERDLEVMRNERDKLRTTVKEKDDRHNDTYLSGWMKNLMPISTALWGEQRAFGPLVKNSNDFTILERRGGKKDSRVWRCKSKQTASLYALKTLRNSISPNAQELGSADLTVLREAMLLKTMDHPNIISLEGIFKDIKGQLNLLLSPFVEIDLEYSVGQRSMNALEVKTLLYQLCLAINYMHKQDIAHRNIKPSNILRFEDYTLKLSGFSYARSVQNQSVDLIAPKSPLWCVAPEVLQAQSSLKATSALDWKAVDVYSNICNIMDINKDSGGKLYPSTSTLVSSLSRSPYSSHPSFRVASSLLQSLLVFDPVHRSTASQALQHEYFAEVNIQRETTKSSRDISRDAQDNCLPRFVDSECAGIL